LSIFLSQAFPAKSNIFNTKYLYPRGEHQKSAHLGRHQIYSQKLDLGEKLAEAKHSSLFFTMSVSKMQHFITLTPVNLIICFFVSDSVIQYSTAYANDKPFQIVLYLQVMQRACPKGETPERCST